MILARFRLFSRIQTHANQERNAQTNQKKNEKNTQRIVDNINNEQTWNGGPDTDDV